MPSTVYYTGYMGYGSWDRLDWNVFLLLDLGLRDDLLFMNYTQALLSGSAFEFMLPYWNTHSFEPYVLVQIMIMVSVDRRSV